jgi:hypothetical protein
MTEKTRQRNCIIYHEKEEVFRGPLDLTQGDLIDKHYPGTYILYEDTNGVVRDYRNI